MQQLLEIQHFATENEEELEQQKKKVNICAYMFDNIFVP